MKTKNTRVRVKDVRQGRVVYIAHPVYGIRREVIASIPYIEKGIGLFVKCVSKYSFAKTFSLGDAGITKGDSYNGRRTFFKLKHAEAWATKWAKDKEFIKKHQRHVARVSSFEGMRLI